MSQISQMTHLQKGAFTAERAENAEIFIGLSLRMLILGSLEIGVVKIRWTRTSAENADKTVLFLSFLSFSHDYASTNFEIHGRSQRAKNFPSQEVRRPSGKMGAGAVVTV